MLKPDHERPGPLRRCLVSGASYPKDQLLRFVRRPDSQEAILDLSGKVPGRGAYLSCNRTIVEQFSEKSRSLLSRAFAAPTRLPEGWREQAARQAEAQLLQRLGLLRRSATLVLGAAALDEALKRGRIWLLILASDAAPNTRAQLEKRASHLPWLDRFSSHDLAIATGRARVVQGGITQEVPKLLSAQARAAVLALSE